MIDREKHPLLLKSFQHLRGIGARTEKHLWSLGIENWESLEREAPKIFGARKLNEILEDLEISREALARENLFHFHRTLPSAERWRIIPGVFHDIAYFDIEASGGGLPPKAESTVIAFLFRGELLQEHDHEAKRRLLEYILTEAKALCTFNGAAYDVPFLAAEFDLPFHKPNLDLCHWLKQQNIHGGLKAVQMAFPHLHQRSGFDMDGWDAVKLWRLYQERRMENALTTLMHYNAEDVLILHPLLVEAYNRQSEAAPELNAGRLEKQALPKLLTDVDESLFEILRSGSWSRRGSSPENSTASTLA